MTRKYERHDSKTTKMCRLIHNSKDGLENFKEAMQRLYREQGILNANQLYLRVTEYEPHILSKGTCYKAFNDPADITIATYRKVCRALSIDFGEAIKEAESKQFAQIREVDEAYKAVKARLLALVSHFLLLDPQKQETVLEMVSGCACNECVSSPYHIASGLLAEQVEWSLAPLHAWSEPQSNKD